MTLSNIAFFIHLATLAVAACGVLYADKTGFSWIRGTTETISTRTLHILHEVMSFSLALLIASGLYLFWPMREYLLGQNLFLLKLGFVAALVVNSLVIDRLMNIATTLPFRWLPFNQKIVLFLSGGFSFACWAGAGVTALLLFGINF